jgi:hypothetical protein
MTQLTISGVIRSRNGASAALFVLLWVAFFFFASAGVRGSDQFWYVSEVRAIMAGDPRSNSLWPHFLLSDDQYLQSRPFIHQGILPYIVALWKGVLNPYQSWIVSNLIFVLSSATFIYFSLHKLRVDKIVSIAAALLFLFLPSTFWSSTQPMTEPAVGFLCAALVFVVTSDISRRYKFVIISFLVLVGQLVVSVFIPIIFISFLCFSFLEFQSDGKKSAKIIYFYSVISLFIIYISLKLGSTLNFDIIQIMMNGTDGRSNMDIWLREEKIPFSIDSYLAKLADSISVFLQFNKIQIFIIPFSLFVIAILIKYIKEIKYILSVKFIKYKNDKNREVFFIFFISLFIYIFIIILHQNQFRYLNFIMPAIIVSLFYSYRNFLSKLLNKLQYVVPVTLGVLLGLCFTLAITLRTESLAVANEVSNVREDANKNGLLDWQTTVIECYRGGQSLLLTYALPEVVFVHADPQNSLQQLRRLKAVTGARLLLCDASPSRHMARKTYDAVAHVRRDLPSLGVETVIAPLR